MATGEQILNGVTSGLGVTLSPIASAVLTARLQQATDAGMNSAIQLSVVLAANPFINAASASLFSISSIVAATQAEFPEVKDPEVEDPVVDDHGGDMDETATELGFTTLEGVLETAVDYDVFKMILEPGQYTYSIQDIVDSEQSIEPIVAALFLENGSFYEQIYTLAVEEYTLDYTFTVDAVGQYYIEVHNGDQSSSFVNNTYSITLSQNEVLPEEPALTAKEAAQSRSYQVGSVEGLATSQTEHVDTLLEESSLWNKQTLTYGFPSAIPTDHSNNGDSSGWRALTTIEQAAFERVVAIQNQYINLDLVKTNSGSTADVRVAAINQDQDVAAYAYYPGSGVGGDVFLDANTGITEEADYYLNDGYGITLILHELGHAMALEHPFEGSPVMPPDVDNLLNTIMTYTHIGFWTTEAQQTGGGGYNYYTVNGFRTDLGIFDVAALQVAYGADMTTNATDTVYRYDEASRSFDASDSHYLTIWDAGGNDTIDASDASFASEINLSDYALSSISQRTPAQESVLVAQAAGLGSYAYSTLQQFIESQGNQAFLNENNLGIAKGVVIENVITGQGNDTVTDNQVDNEITTGAGNDLIILGNGGYDVINGGIGFDTVRLAVASSDVQIFEDETGFYIAAANFGAQLIGVEQIEYSDTTIVV